MAWLALFTATYRFNTLGGALGGFDNDHFVHFAYAKQVQAGEQPLRDFDGIGLQGAWPSLTYEASAAAQSLLGNNLRSEAILNVAGLTLAAVLTFHAASRFAGAGWALGATLLTVLLAPKLYTYPKVLLLAAAIVAVIAYARRRSAGGVAMLAGIAAIAFLFRHDYAAYVGVPAVVVLAAGAGGVRRAVLHLGMFGLVTLVLLAPSLGYVQRHAGLVEYFREGLDQSRIEAARTDLARPTFTGVDAGGQPLTAAGVLSAEQNAVSMLYYLHIALPLIVLAIVLARRRWKDWAVPALIACCAAALFANELLLRGNVGARLGDVGPISAVLMATLMQTLFASRRGTSRIVYAVRLGVGVLLVTATCAAVWTVGSVRRELDTSGWSDSLEKLTLQAGRRWEDLAGMPAAFWSTPQESPTLRAAQYINRCTAPDDRVVVLAYQHELLALADRRFGAGRAAILPDILNDDGHERVMLERWRSQRVPIVLAASPDDYESDYRGPYALVDAYLQAHYEAVGTLDTDGGQVLQVLRDRRLTPARTFGDGNLPCFL